MQCAGKGNGPSTFGSGRAAMALAIAVALALISAACTSTHRAKASTTGGTGSTAATSTVAAGSGTSGSSGGPSTSTSVALTPAITAPPPPSATTVTTTMPPPVAVPTLRIITPKSGETVSAPVPVQYAVSGFDVGPGRGAMQLTLGDGGGFGVSMQLSGPSGVVYLDDPRLSGVRTLVFTLITADGRALTNAEATVRIPNVTVTGGR
jgi:hypothetical protein